MAVTNPAGEAAGSMMTDQQSLAGRTTAMTHPPDQADHSMVTHQHMLAKCMSRFLSTLAVPHRTYMTCLDHRKVQYKLLMGILALLQMATPAQQMGSNKCRARLQMPMVLQVRKDPTASECISSYH